MQHWRPPSNCVSSTLRPLTHAKYATLMKSYPCLSPIVYFESIRGPAQVILATNIAETSITVAGVRYVVDAGFVKARAYQARQGTDFLQAIPVSQAQARQRSGRAGCPR